MARRYVIVMADDCPPADQPWLISSRGELARDKQKIGAMAKGMQEAHPFPPPSSYVKMLQWAESVEEAMHDDFIWGMEAHVHRLICFEHAPQSMELQLLVNRADVDNLLKHADSTKFLQSSYLRRSPKSATKSVSAFAAWVSKADVGTAISQTYLGHPAAIKPELCLVASMPCAKTDDLFDAMQSLCKSLGLEGSTLRMPDCGVYQKLTQFGKRVGEHPFFAETAAHGAAAVPLLLKQGPPPPVDPMQAKQPKSWVSRLREQEKASEGARAFMIVKKADTLHDEDDDEEDDEDDDDGCDEKEEQRKQRPATHRMLWLPGVFNEDRERVGAHVREGRGETTSIQARMEKGNTDTGNLTYWMLSAEVNAMKDEIGGPHTFTARQRKLSRALAITLAFVEGGDYWMHDNECDEELSELVESLGKYWRTVLLVESDETIGLGLTSSTADGAASRAALYALLKQLGTSIERNVDGAKFNAVPGPKRVRKRKGETEEEVAARRAEMRQTKASGTSPMTNPTAGGKKKHKRVTSSPS